MALFRQPDCPAFSARETRLAVIVMEEVSWLYRDDPEPAGPDVFPRLSPRQTAVAGLLAQGLSRKEIAGRLGITRHTLGGYIRDIYRHLGVRSQAALIHNHAGSDRQNGPSG